jgi:AraC-like DNA-binding protein
MFAHLNSRDEPFEKFLSTFNSLAPHAKIELDSGRGAFRWQGKFASTRGFSWWEVESEVDWTCRFPHRKERLGLILPSAGTARARIRDRGVAVEPEGALVLSVPEVDSISYSGPGRHGHVTLEFDMAIVQNTLSAIFEGASLRNLELNPQVDLASPAGLMLKALGTAVGAGMRDPTIRSEKSMALLGESILRLVFLSFPHRFAKRLHGRDTDAVPREIRAAVEFMHANMHQALTLSEVADAAGISSRSLQYGFRRFRDVTPLAYLRDIRLEAVRTELSSPLNALPIKDVALKWGFGHLGHFAARYRAAFGETPSDTARLARVERSGRAGKRPA